MLGEARNFDVDLQSRCRRAAIHPHLDVFELDRNLLGNRRQNIVAQNGDQLRLAACRPFAGQEDLEPFPRDWSGTPAPE